jgi:hypothetical protein
MPAVTTINVYDRPTYQTEKVKGWDTVRVFKGSSLVSNRTDTDMIFSAVEGDYLIQKFLNAGSNYKGTNRFDLTKLENFDSFRLKANGIFNPLTGGVRSRFKMGFCILDNGYSELVNQEFNYGDSLGFMPFNNYWTDWYLDIEVTFFIDENDNSYNFIVNGNFSVQKDTNPNDRLDVSLVPFCGLLTTTTNDIVMDFKINLMDFTDSLYIKQINIDFVE